MSGNPPEIVPKTSERIFLGDCQFDIHNSELFTQNGRSISLRNQSAKVLTELAKTPGKTVSKDILVSAVWGDTYVTDDSLVQCIKDIRKVLGDNDHKIIRTVPRMGYRLDTTDHGKLKDISGQSILLESVHVVDDSVGAHYLAEEFFEHLVLVLSRRTEVRIFTDENTQEPIDYIVRCRTSVSGRHAKLFISLSETTIHGTFYTESFKSDLCDIEKFAEDVAKEISSTLRIFTVSHGGSKYTETPDSQLDNAQLLSKAMYLYSSITSKDTDIGRATMQVAVDRAPDNPKALAMLAHSTTQMYPIIINDLSVEEINWSMSLADRAVAVGPSFGFAFRTRGNLRLWLLGDHQGCEADCRRALELNPYFYLTHLTLATSEILSGNYMEGEKRINSFVRFTSIDPQYPFYLSLIALACFLRDEKDKALEMAKEAYERMPTTPWFALVYAVTAGEFASVVQTSEFGQMISELELPKSYFRKLPFAKEGDIAKLERNLDHAGMSN